MERPRSLDCVSPNWNCCSWPSSWNRRMDSIPRSPSTPAVPRSHPTLKGSSLLSRPTKSRGSSQVSTPDPFNPPSVDFPHLISFKLAKRRSTLIYRRVGSSLSTTTPFPVSFPPPLFDLIGHSNVSFDSTRSNKETKISMTITRPTQKTLGFRLAHSHCG